MSIVIAFTIVVLVSLLIAKYYPKKSSTTGFAPKPIPESTRVIPPTPEILTPTIKKEEETFFKELPKKRKYNKKKDSKKMDAKKA
jgi:hypothetical protein